MLQNALEECTGDAHDAHGSVGADDGGGGNPVVGGERPSGEGGHWGGLAEGEQGEEEQSCKEVHAHGDWDANGVDGGV